MNEKGILEDALNQEDLLKQVVDFKRKFYPRNWARYDLANLESIKLVPAEHSIRRLSSDYSEMKEMIYGEYPTFDTLMKKINDIENKIHDHKALINKR